MPRSNKNLVEDNEAIKNLLIISLLKDGVDPRIVALATGMPEKTIRNKFPMKLIKNMVKDNEQK